MNAWLLAASLCAPASAAVVVEAGGVAAPALPVSGAVGAAMGVGTALSPILVVPGASFLAPGLNAGSAVNALPERAAANLPAVAAGFSPAPMTAHLAAPGATLQAAAARRDSIPSSPAVDREISTSLDPVSEESAAASGRKIFDRDGDRALLPEDSAPGTPGTPVAGRSRSFERRDPLLAASSGANGGGEALGFMWHPSGMATDSKGYLYVAQRTARRYGNASFSTGEAPLFFTRFRSVAVARKLECAIDRSTDRLDPTRPVTRRSRRLRERRCRSR